MTDEEETRENIYEIQGTFQEFVNTFDVDCEGLAEEIDKRGYKLIKKYE